MINIGVFKFASCDGCQLAFFDVYEKILEISEINILFFLEAQSENKFEHFDISFIEGSVSTSEDKELIKKIREKSKKVVTIGACATSGGIQSIRNYLNYEQIISYVYPSPEYIKSLEKSHPISDFIDVDYELRGCPINREHLIEVINSLLLNKTPTLPRYPVCFECKIKGNLCVLVLGKPCLGNITVAGCGSICPSLNRGCYRCFGPIEKPKELAKYYIKKFSELNFPEDDIGDIHFVSLFREGEYAILNGEIISDNGLKIDKDEFKDIFVEFQVKNSTAKKCRIYGREVYMVGAISRFNNNYEMLSGEAIKISKDINLSPPIRNSFKSILVRMIEIVHSMEKSLEIINNYRKPDRIVEIRTKESEGTGVSEAPRGILWHRYSFDSNGRILSADIVPPTSQNQDIMELDTLNFVRKLKNRNDILKNAERVVRNYDPCISCATHLIEISD